MEKAEARTIVGQAVGRLSHDERREKSEAIRRRLLALPELGEAGCVMAYLPMRDEWDTRPFLAALIAAGKRVYVPRSFPAEKRMAPVRLDTLDGLREGAYGIAEPDSDETCKPSAIDFMLLPARAFDRQGNRLGRGAGFYDRFLATEGCRGFRCGAGFACQLLAAVPHDEHDLPVQAVVTEAETIRAARRLM